MFPTRSGCLLAGILAAGLVGCSPSSRTSNGSTTGSTGSTSSTGQSSTTSSDTGTSGTTGSTGTTGSSGSTGTSGSTGSSGTTGADYAWPQWPVPPASPPTSEYTTTTDTVTDTVTGLMWQRVMPSGTYTWQSAKDYCSTLALGGYSDWRLPTRIELVSIVDYGAYNPAINSTAFPNTPSNWFWTSSSFAFVTGDAWGVGFDYGHTYDSSTKTSVRCVRGRSGVSGGAGSTSAPPGQYTVTADTVHDNKTGLTWQRAAASGTYTQPDGSSYCQALTLGGVSGWRLPTVKEIQTIVDERTYNPAIDTTAFPNTPVDYFWTLSPNVFDPGDAWIVYFYHGTTNYGPTTSTSSVRCVR